MSTVKADTVQAKDFASDLTLGASGDTVTVAADSINVNKVQDKGGNTLWDYSTGEFVGANSAFASQSLKLLATQVIDQTYTSISFITGIDSTYDVYIFKFINIRVTTSYDFAFQCSTDGGDTFATTLTSTAFRAWHSEAGTGNLSYDSERDRVQQTLLQPIMWSVKTDDADGNGCGELTLFNPSNTTYAKHWFSTTQHMHPEPASINPYNAGYFNTTSAINAITFAACEGDGAGGLPNVLGGTIKMYGLL
jgi:hypothetical protein